MPATVKSAPVDRAPAPWTLQAECYIFPHYVTSATVRANRAKSSSPPSSSAVADNFSPDVRRAVEQSRRDATSRGLEPGAFHPLEDHSPSAAARDVFKGGFAGWMLFRYSDSPAGPYDEIIYTPGSFESPSLGQKTLRITNIYVSTEESVWNGRTNWNIPKHVARFDWSKDASTGATTVSIYHPSNSPLASSAERPFFRAALSDARWLPSLPINTTYSWLPQLPLVQPPLKQGVYEDKTRQADVATATEPTTYRSVAPTFKGSVCLAYCRPALASSALSSSSSSSSSSAEAGPSYGDGVSFPEGRATWGFGIHLPRVEVGFPLPKEFDVPAAAKGD